MKLQHPSWVRRNCRMSVNQTENKRKGIHQIGYCLKYLMTFLSPYHLYIECHCIVCFSDDRPRFEHEPAWVRHMGGHCHTWYEFGSGSRCRIWRGGPSPTLDVSLVSSPKSRLLRTSTYSSFSFFVTPNAKPLCLPLLFARARFSRICISAAVPFIGSWKTLPIYLALLCSGSFVTSMPSTVMVPQSTG